MPVVRSVRCRDLRAICVEGKPVEGGPVEGTTPFLRKGLLFLLPALIACGATSPSTLSTQGGAPDGADQEAVSGGGASASGAHSVDSSLTDSTPAAHRCESVAPLRLTVSGVATEEPDFQQGHRDPCAAVDPACALDMATGRCVPFVAPSACPATMAEAQQQTVFCMHPQHAAHACAYAEGVCECVPPPPYCGGPQPHPRMLNQPTDWQCRAHTHTQGCPTRSFSAGESCDADEQTQCLQGCSSVFQCIRGRWQQTGELPPRP